MSLLPALPLLAAVDAINPASITGALYVAGSGRRGRPRLFILAVYATYMVFGLALVFGPGAALRSVLRHNRTLIGAGVEVALGVLLVGIGLRIWRRPARRHEAASPAALGRRSALALGVVTTLADLPTAGPLFVASVLIAAADGSAWARLAGLLLYNIVYVAPLVAIAVAHNWITGATTPGLRSRPALLAWVPVAVTGLCLAGGVVIGMRGASGLIGPAS